MVSRGEIIDNVRKIEDMMEFLSLLYNLHKTALFTWKIEAVDHYLPQDDIDELIDRYKSLKTQLATKYGELL